MVSENYITPSSSHQDMGRGQGTSAPSIFLKRLEWLYSLHFFQLLRLRYLEILARAHVVALVQVLVPFAVVYLMCFSCSEFPRIKLKISSDRVGGFGEVMGSVWNRNMSSNHNRTAIGLATQHPISWQQPLAYV